MTTPISVGDLVLRDGKVEEVEEVSPWSSRYLPKGWMGTRGDFPDAKNATRIGATSDGWRIHAGTKRPEGVGADELINVVCASNLRFDGVRPKQLFWNKFDPIVAYRIVPRATQSTTPSAETLKAVAAEMRETARIAPGKPSYANCCDIVAWADRIDPPAPKPLAVGDRVRHTVGGDGGVIKHIEGDHAMVLYDDKGSSTYVVWHIGNLERVS